MAARRSSAVTAASVVSELEDIFEAVSNDEAGSFDLEKVVWY